ncbi:MAG: hypothetical protein NC923_00150 [Candidatus Omnitrophica bacterium]|nr:hypothetical protein [Candidatus Omnitrophota bacterium]
MEKLDLKNLKKRYLVWLYKTTKEELDKIERKFTQLEIDRFLLREIIRMDSSRKLVKFISDFHNYICNKEKEAKEQKFLNNNEINPEYNFLHLKLKAVEKAILKELGKDALKEIKLLYEMEMIERILKSTERR